jgi:hypothetical protein
LENLSRWIFVFALAVTFFILAPPFLNAPFPPYPLMAWADALDILTPLAVLPLYWLLFQFADQRKPALGAGVVFMLLAAMWAEGQGMHLSANSIGHLVPPLPGDDLFDLTYFYDEDLSHFLWHLGIIGLSAILVYRQWSGQAASAATNWRWVLPAGLLYGFTFAAAVLEGGTVVVGVPFALLFVGFTLIRGRNRLRDQPLISFFFASYLLACILFIIWGSMCGGFPEPMSGECPAF